MKNQLYCSRDGKFYRLRNAKLIPMTPSVVTHYNRKTCHTRYPIVTRSSPRIIHVLMALTWIGPRPFTVTPHGQTTPMEIDHLNGDILDWRADNLQYVTPAENRKRAKLLRVLRSIGREPRQMTREELLEIFNKYTFTNH